MLQQPTHCESGTELWLQGQAALQKPSFRDAEQNLISHQKLRNHERPPMQLRQGINICLTTTDPVNLSLHGNAMMPIAPGEVNLYLVL